MHVFALISTVVSSALVGVASQSYCPDFNPDDAQPCTSTPTLGDMCTLPSLSERVRPGQPAVGFVLRDCKTAKFNSDSEKKFEAYMKEHPIPVVLGPNETMFITDHHHLLSGLGRSSRAGATAYFCPQTDFSNTTWDNFFDLMQSNHLIRLRDNHGNRIAIADLPTSIAGLDQDDPYRSLMEWVRDDYGFIKCEAETASRPECVASQQKNVPFLEYIWADAMRSRFTFAPSNVYSENTTMQVSTMLPELEAILETTTNVTYKDFPGFNTKGDYNIDNTKIDALGCE